MKTLSPIHNGLIAMIMAWSCTGTAWTQTVRDFDTPAGTPFLTANCVPFNPGAAPPQELPGGPSGVGNFLRLATTSQPLPISNSIAFNLTDPGLFTQVIAEFDFRMTTIAGGGRADGFGFALLSTANYGNIGEVCPTLSPFVPEEPNFTGSFGVGFDIFQNLGHESHPNDINNNHISIHFDGDLLQQFDVTAVDLAGAQWVHCKITMRPGGGFSDVSVFLTPLGGQPVAVINNFQVPGFGPYEGRVFFGARSGGETAEHDIDNIDVQFSGVPDPAVFGQWSSVFDAEIVAVHLNLLPTGKVLFWQNGGIGQTLLDQIRLWDPGANTLSTPALPTHDIFCSGHSFLADGGLLVTGGHDNADGVGLPNASIYDAFTDSWTSLPNMNEGRWYPTNTTLANGDVLVISGVKDANFTKNTLSQVWQTASGTWRDLTTAQEVAPLGVDLYPRMFLTRDGRVFKAGPDQDTWYLDTSGSGTWTQGPASNFGLRTYGSAVMYDLDKILITGGGEFPPTATAEVIDLNNPTPAWRFVAAMTFARRHLNATLLPDGKVLATSGTSSPEFNNANNAVRVAEIWDPETEIWSTMAAMHVPRLYHSTALLLPDGRVFVSGGGRFAPAGLVENQDFEIFSPPYLFGGLRPTITSTPATLTYGQSFDLQTPDATSITNVNLIRMPSVTHAFDQNQRMIKLGFSQASDGLAVTAPDSGSLAPPGHYMLFILNGNGVPSAAQIIQIMALPVGNGPIVFRVERTTGDVFADGSFIPSGADLAERIRVTEPVEPGDVVEFDPANPQHYRKARGSSQLVAGVITTEPGFTLGNNINKMESAKVVAAKGDVQFAETVRPMLALMGRVPVKATTENGPIRPGDLLTVSSKPGYAMRCADAKECDGVIIGKALEGLEKGDGLISVLVMAH